jgi:hypothetical protein
LPTQFVEQKCCLLFISVFLVQVLRLRAKQYEGTRFRCCAAQCPLLAKGSLAEGQDSSNIPEEDREVDLFDAMLEDEEADDEDGEDLEESMNRKGLTSSTGNLTDKLDKPVDIWPFAHSCFYYEQLMKSLAQPESCSHFVALTTTGHPASWHAARSLGLKACHHDYCC